ncbi:hypothetical protein SBA3_2570004 [Candidatus Sulfopaludibacter sp. SbA3]|nr:hypothetical protein SBA3_2570004 [Candidatus Sulfopaludibacter sp. SbA3]
MPKHCRQRPREQLPRSSISLLRSSLEYPLFYSAALFKGLGLRTVQEHAGDRPVTDSITSMPSCLSRPE